MCKKQYWQNQLNSCKKHTVACTALTRKIWILYLPQTMTYIFHYMILPNLSLQILCEGMKFNIYAQKTSRMTYAIQDLETKLPALILSRYLIFSFMFSSHCIIFLVRPYFFSSSLCFYFASFIFFLFLVQLLLARTKNSVL